MITVEQTEPVETGLHFAIKADDGRILAWTYSISMAESIADGMNNFWRHGDGEARCVGCYGHEICEISPTFER